MVLIWFDPLWRLFKTRWGFFLKPIWFDPIWFFFHSASRSERAVRGLARFSSMTDETKKAVTTETDAKPKKVVTDGPPKPKKAASKKTGEPRPKRGPARPYRKLEQGVLDTRITKLQKRLDRAKGQMEEAETFLRKYEREKGFREPDDEPTE